MRNTRIELSPLAHKALLVEAAIMGVTPKNRLEQLIFQGVESEQARSVIYPQSSKEQFPKSAKPWEFELVAGNNLVKGEADERGLLPGETLTPGFKVDRENGRITRSPDEPKKQKTPIDQSPELVERVKALWGQNVRTTRAIAAEIGYSKTAVANAIIRMKESGVLKG